MRYGMIHIVLSRLRNIFVDYARHAMKRIVFCCCCIALSGANEKNPAQSVAFQFLQSVSSPAAETTGKSSAREMITEVATTANEQRATNDTSDNF